MDKSVCIKLLQSHGIKPTANRIVIAEALAAKDNHPLSLKELEISIQTIDKSNISRALTLFKEQHLVHTIEDGVGSIRYELCMSHCFTDDKDEEDDDMHVHFYCEECHRTTCLYDIPLPPITLSSGYEMHSANYLITGICPDCLRKRFRHPHV
ncbi:MAG: transcriptional repressor [Prevotella sp.]|jgi:Fur family ferric uptake transcriptional regulator|nr:transcriptional repressor [Prevotella sp.]MCH4182767.1 transcriptional repressor [Prevotella sp.]MCH4211303.1 transcriptional repressor [Prevotella sp.]MCH4240536.1 transcriptional repressor [Prevotella sp.]